MSITFVTAVNNRTILEKNLLASPALHEGENYEIIVQEHYSSAAKAYNEAINRSTNDLMIFLHQDIYLPAGWLSRLHLCIAAMELKDAQWAVAGCWGVTQDGNGWGHVYTPGLGVIGEQFDEPKPVQTLDEIVLIMRKSAGLRFDERLPHYHLYGTDLCLAARARGFQAYAISAFCIHNSTYIQVLPPEFYKCYCYIKHKWMSYLPIQTSCIRISRFDVEVRRRRVKELWRTFLGRTVGEMRAEDPREVHAQLGTAGSCDTSLR